MNRHGKAFSFTISVCFSALLITVAFGADGKSGAMVLTSPAFQPGADIPRKYTCDAQDVSPPLRWTDVPAATKSFALTVDDPDAPGGTWVHWVAYDLPPDSKDLPEGVRKSDVIANGARQGKNDFGKIGYNGPCPPPGAPHHYHFKLYALDAAIGLKPRATKQQLLDATKGHVLGEAELIGRYKR